MTSFTNDVPNSTIFAERLNLIMEMKGLKNRDLAKKIYVAETTISGYRNGRRFPDLDRLTLLCTAIPVSANFLLGLNSDPYIE